MDSAVNNFAMVLSIKVNSMAVCSTARGNSDGKTGVNMKAHGEITK